MNKIFIPILVFLIGCKLSTGMVICPIWCGEGTILDPNTNTCIVDNSGMYDMECDPRNDKCGFDMFCSPTYMKCMKNMELGQKCPDNIGNEIITCNADKNLYCLNGYCLPNSFNIDKCSMVKCEQGYRCDPNLGYCIKMNYQCYNGMPCQQGEFCNKHTNMCERYRNEGESCIQSDDYCKLGLKCSSKNFCIN
ncbi:hypothetical protein BpHYR1_016074 [Brachionus plicatilis]|uniref:Uncharacterized protein n=1 Tax=Brachionus plicatilis TaxID=10195 RepID=A0A3M7SLS2_BRAPC|nr:hypothetical protein BpHYR1_016074 [Brachionus plicatilis]